MSLACRGSVRVIGMMGGSGLEDSRIGDGGGPRGSSSRWRARSWSFLRSRDMPSYLTSSAGPCLPEALRCAPLCDDTRAPYPARRAHRLASHMRGEEERLNPLDKHLPLTNCPHDSKQDSCNRICLQTYTEDPRVEGAYSHGRARGQCQWQFAAFHG